MCVADTGFDNGSDTDAHEKFAGRVKGLYSWDRANRGGATDDLDGHGTHVCGSLLGTGRHSSQGLIKGATPGSKLIMQSLFGGFHSRTNLPLLGGIPKGSLASLFGEAYNANARIHTNSWGSSLPQDTKIQQPRSESIDRFVWEYQDMTVLFAAGNDGQDIDTEGKLDGTVNPGAEAAFKNRHRLAAFSSRGLAAENRLKPDAVAPGTTILSARSQSKKNLSSVDLLGISEDPK